MCLRGVRGLWCVIGWAWPTCAVSDKRPKRGCCHGTTETTYYSQPLATAPPEAAEKKCMKIARYTICTFGPRTGQEAGIRIWNRTRRGGNRTTTNIRRMPKGHHIPNNIICFCGPLKRFSPHFSFLILFCVQQANNAQVALTKKRKQGSKFQVLQRIIRMLIYTNMLNPPIYIFSHQQS